jgi:hypothetical protein
MRDHSGVDPEPAERVASALAVDDDAVEACEEPAPELLLRRRSAREQIVRGQDERAPARQQALVELGRGEPLEVQDVGAPPRESRHPERVLGRLEREPQAGPPEEP